MNCTCSFVDTQSTTHCLKQSYVIDIRIIILYYDHAYINVTQFCLNWYHYIIIMKESDCVLLDDQSPYVTVCVLYCFF